MYRFDTFDRLSAGKLTAFGPRAFSLFFGLLILLQPLAALAAEEVMADDTIAGFGTEIVITDLDADEVDVIIITPDGRDIIFSEEVDRSGTVEISLRSRETELAGVYEVEVEDDRRRLVAEGSFVVFPDALSLEHSSISIEDDRIEEGEEVRGTVELLDRYGNPLEDRPVRVSASRREDDIIMLDDETDRRGQAEFLFRSDEVGESSLIAMDLLSGDPLEDRIEIEVVRYRSSRLRSSLLDEYDREDERETRKDRYGFIDSFEVLIAEKILRVNEQVDFTVVGIDRNGNQVEDYIGKVIIETTDPDAQVPNNAVKFFASDRGSVDLPLALMFGTPGLHSVCAQDQDDPDIAGCTDVRVVGGSSAITSGKIVIENPTDGGNVGAGQITVRGTAPAFINLELYDNEELLALGESDSEGHFSFTVSLDAEVEIHTLVVREGEGGLDRTSEPALVTIDTSAPTIQDIVLLPSTVTPGQTFTVSVTAESGQEVSARIGDGQSITLSAGTDENGIGVYQGTLTAPQTVGTTEVTALIRDAAQNESQQSRTLTVQSMGLQIVQNVIAIVEGQDILLSWTVVSAASQYRVYFGDSPTNLTNHIDTASSATAVRLTGLKGGRTYYFVLTALGAAGRESEGKSTVVSAVPRGSLFGVQLTPQINGARMQWTMPPGVDIAGYRIQYGVQPSFYTEQRLLPASQNGYTFQDLINGVTYYVSLSAVQKDGKLMVDPIESTVVPGQNSEPGFHLSPLDPLPAAIGGPPVSSRGAHAASSPLQTQYPPVVPQTGLPLFVWASLVLLLAGSFMGWRMYRDYKIQRNIVIALSDQS